MKTEELIKALAADDDTPRAALGLRLAAAIAVGFVLSAAIFALVLGPRPDAANALSQEPRFLLKFVVTLTLALSAAGFAMRLLRPGAATGWWSVVLLLGPALLFAGILYELATIAPAVWRSRLVGNNSMVCLFAVPMLAAPVLAALIYAMRDGAPMRPALAGAVGGLVAAGLGATLYAAHCADDSPFFVATWYGIGTAIVVAVGALAGARFLRW